MKKLAAIVLFSLALTSQAQIADAPENVSPLLIGEKIPNTELSGIDGKKVKTDKIFNKKTVLVVYRGGWCPYCNNQLADMQEIESDILSLGYQIVAISPDSPSFLKETETKDKLNYALYSDSEGKFSQAIGIAFAAPEKYGKMLGKYSDDKNTSFLPVPTVYVLNEKQEIEFMYINPNYATRLKGELLLAVLKNL
ncbi:peroxiredoxin-like family protein [uncultured Flavobacterium sp.]|uniref:peroxiredoxin-like family protein n=1 Tax=uncultured Flavobacterium sp. TaxID=165435 RepID=UPI0030EE119F|tara:strand:+ start:208954 stop:209538 length:585 start_codon:yes stop_codon:yes gene_type:complete